MCQEVTGRRRIPKGLRGAHKVSAQKREEHDRTHTPFEPWCKYCVGARGRSMARRKKKTDEEAEEKVPRISMDDHFLSKKDEEACTNPVLIMTDESTGEKFARAVAHKGPIEWLVKDMVKELRSWGS